MPQSLTFQADSRLTATIAVVRHDPDRKATDYTATLTVNGTPLVALDQTDEWGYGPLGGQPALHSLMKQLFFAISEYLVAWNRALMAGHDHTDPLFDAEVYEVLVTKLAYQHEDFVGFARSL